MTPTWMDLISQDARALIASEIRDLFKLTEQPNMISFAGDVPDPLLFPRDDFRDVYHALLQDTHQTHQALQYSISGELPSLRQWIQVELARDNSAVNTQQILITNGTQQAFSSRRPTLISIDPDGQGPHLDRLERAFAEGARLAYLAPDFQIQSGVVTPLNDAGPFSRWHAATAPP